MIRKWLAIGIILLFVGVIITPTINFNTVKASTDDDLVEVTTQACGIRGYGDTTVKLTRELYQNLEEYLVEFRARLNQTSTREEAVPIFKEAVVELDKYGLLPKGMSVERAMRLMIRSNDQRLKVFDSLELDPDANYLCLVSGLTSNTKAIGPLIYLAICLVLYMEEYDILGQIYSWLNAHNLGDLIYLVNIVAFPYMIWSLFGPVLTTFLPFGLLSILTFGTTVWYESDSSSGWVFSIGLNGVKVYADSDLRGAAKDPTYIGMMIEVYPGVLGFTGLKLTLLTSNFDKTFFLGSALKVKLGT